MIDFSVVVNTYDRAVLLDDALRGIARLRYDAFEVVVVNGPSTDDTEAVLARAPCRITRVSCPEANLARSRNLGLAAALGEVVAFIDDDAVPHPEWLTELSYAYADPRVGGVGGFTFDPGGVGFQAQKTVCDRFGNAHAKRCDYDERVLNRPGSPYFPSLLGTNASFRRAAVRAVGGFDPAFTYFLEETDLCLRLVDGGWRVVYAAEALVFHQFAPSATRDARRVPRHVEAIVASKSYFILRHGARADLEAAGREMAAYEAKMRADNARLLHDRAIDPAHKIRLDQELERGIARGRERAFAGDGGPWLAGPSANGFAAWRAPRLPRLAVVTRTPSAWLETLLRSLAGWGWTLHLLHEGPAPSVRFEAGVWRHCAVAVAGEGAVLAAREDIPVAVADSCQALARTYDQVRGFGIDLLASTTRGLPGVGLLDDIRVLLDDGSTETDLAAHPQWRQRPLYRHFHVGKLIAVERRAGQRIAPRAGPPRSDAAIAAMLAAMVAG